MKKTLFLLAILTSQLHHYAQNCVDSSLIDLDAACPLIWAPVCGCNGETYANDCEAVNFGGVTSYTPGECAGGGCMDMTGLDFGLCDMFLGYTWLGGSCAAMSGCGYIIGNIDYSPNFYTTAWECQQACGSPLTDCINQWQIEQGYLVDCYPNIDPVCGCNDITYDNACMAFYYGGVTNYQLGPCGTSTCRVIPISISFGECAMPLGWARLDTGCTMLSGCSYIGNNGYDYNNLFFNSETECLFGCPFEPVCVDTTLINPEMMCPAVVDPVCGCDGITYNNSCEATNWYGITSYTQGPCGLGVAPSFDMIWNAYPNPFEQALTLNFTSALPEELRVYNTTGKLITAIRPSNATVQLETSQWQSGAYMIFATYGGNTTAKKVVIKAD